MCAKPCPCVFPPVFLNITVCARRFLFLPSPFHVLTVFPILQSLSKIPAAPPKSFLPYSSQRCVLEVFLPYILFLLPVLLVGCRFRPHLPHGLFPKSVFFFFLFPKILLFVWFPLPLPLKNQSCDKRMGFDHAPWPNPFLLLVCENPQYDNLSPPPFCFPNRFLPSPLADVFFFSVVAKVLTLAPFVFVHFSSFKNPPPLLTQFFVSSSEAQRFSDYPYTLPFPPPT